MIRISIYLLLIIFVLFSCKTMNDKKNNISFFKEYYNDGSLKSECYFISDSIKSGKKKIYYPNGEIMFEITYENNIKQGSQKEYYENGVLKSIGWNNKGLPDSLFVAYYENGIIKSRTRYRKGKLFAEAVYYYSNGNIQKYAFHNPLGKCCYIKEYNDKGIMVLEEGKHLAFIVYENNKLNVDDTFRLKIFIATPINVKQDLSIKLKNEKKIIDEKIVKIRDNIGYYNFSFEKIGRYRLFVNLQNTELSDDSFKNYTEEIPIYIH